MESNNERTLSEAVSYYEDFEGELEESLFQWLVGRAKKADIYERTLTEIANHPKDSLASYSKEYGDVVTWARNTLYD